MNKKKEKIAFKIKFESFNFNQLLVFLLLMLLGIIITLQFKSIEDNRRKVEAGRSDYNFYLELLESELNYTEAKEIEIEQMQEKKVEVLEEALFNLGNIELLEDYQRARQLAGFTDITGEGIIVTLDDQLLEDPSFPTATSIIHDLDIRHVVDVMKSNGAIAISINGDRVVGTSELICNGPTVQINKNKHPVPYVVEAIGDVNKIKAAFENDSYIEGRILSNISFLIELKSEITISGFSQDDKIEYFIDVIKGGVE